MENLELKELINKTAIVIRQKKELEAKEEAYKKRVQEFLSKCNIDTVTTSLVTVTKVNRKSYSYSPEVQNIEKELKLKKSQEEIYGIATEKLKSYYMYSLDKEFARDEYDDFSDI